MKSQQSRSVTHEAGFSMIELSIAMMITLIVSGAIYALVGAGGNAFRREPALTDRQQNIRVAMDLVTRDVHNAGANTPISWIQLFAQGLNGVGPIGPDGATDFLQVVGNDGSCADMNVCSFDGSSMTTAARLPGCYGMPGLVLAYNDKYSSILFGCEKTQGTANKKCGEGAGNDTDGRNGHVVFPHGKSPYNPPGGKLRYPVGCQLNDPPCEEWDPTGIAPVAVNRYEIRIDAEGTPNLWRSGTGGENPADDVAGNACDADVGGFGAGWQVVARGVENMQIRYMSQTSFAGAKTWADEPPVMGQETYGSIVRQVEIVLGARTVQEANLAGETAETVQNTAGGATGVVRAVRGNLRSVVSPRAALQGLSKASPNPLYK